MPILKKGGNKKRREVFKKLRYGDLSGRHQLYEATSKLVFWIMPDRPPKIKTEEIT
jgi:hypothetical protein